MKKMLREFREFMDQGDFVTIAVGLVMALYVKTIVDSIIDGVINPIIAAIVGKPSLTDFGFDLGDSRISIGAVINAVIVFILVGLLLFFLLKAYNKFRNRRRAGPDEPIETELEVLRQIRDELRTPR
jgi:large conductance mechanosensitive channel